MFQINDNYQKLPGSYLFSTIGKKVSAYQAANPDKNIIRLGIGDVTQPLAPAIIEAMHKAVDEIDKETPHHIDEHGDEYVLAGGDGEVDEAGQELVEFAQLQFGGKSL